MTAENHAEEMLSGQRFGFGENWAAFLWNLNEDRIGTAETALADMLERHDLTGLSLLDAGSGSGLSSLAAHRLGARVHSFDYDPASVACTEALRRRYGLGGAEWTVEAGSVLNRDYLEGLGQFDVVYSWGVLHHTGAMWTAIDNVSGLCRPGGLLFIAIYNHMGGASRRWTAIKALYCRLPRPLRSPFALLVTLPIQLWSFLAHALQGKLGVWIDYFRTYSQRRGMSWWRDQLDWIGGYPYEDARPEEVFDFLRTRGFALRRLKTFGGGIGCNEFVFERTLSA